MPQKVEPKVQEKKDSLSAQKSYISSLKTFVIYLIIALLASLFMEKRLVRATDSMLTRFWPATGIGTTVLLLTPSVILTLVLTIIGIPLSVLVLAAYIFAIFVSRIFTAIALGKKITDKYWKDKKDSLRRLAYFNRLYALGLGRILQSPPTCYCKEVGS